MARSHAETFSEVDVRAVYLFNFAVFVDWPSSAFESSTSPIRYCVVGSQALRASLELVLDDEHVGGRALQLMPATEPLNWRRCHLLYIGHGAKTRARQILTAVRGAAVLTIGASEEFVREGGMIGLVRRGQRLRAIVDRDAAERVGIRISSKLLRLSTLVSGIREGVAP
ncbi:YfiR family protein [Thiorhodococcus fuscus]|uniref:YfiR family protein n=1 Tax=Thiorhodococcus fuscus TaxID=527200 RepID=A0ABW4YDT6_9GAMM